MIIAEKPSNEIDRLEALRSCRLLDTEPEPGFDNLARHAAKIAQTPTALVSLVDGDRQWFKARYGFAGHETPRDLAFCAHTILESEPLVVEDAALDERFRDNPLVSGFPDIRFYAGFPVHGPDGHPFGTLCVIDTETRSLNPDQMETLGMLAGQVEAQIELRSVLGRLDEIEDGQEAVLDALSQVARTTYDGAMSAHRYLARTQLDAEQQAYLAFSVDCTHHLAAVLEDIARRLKHDQ